MSYTFLSDLNNSQQAQPPQAPPQQMFFQQSGGLPISQNVTQQGQYPRIPQYENQPGPMYPQLDNTAMQMQGSRNFYQPPQPPQPQQPFQQQQQQQQGPKRYDAETTIRMLSSALQESKTKNEVLTKALQNAALSSSSDSGKGKTDLLIGVLLVIFIIVIFVLFKFCKKITT